MARLALIGAPAEGISMPVVGIDFGEPRFDQAEINDSQICCGSLLQVAVVVLTIALAAVVLKPHNAIEIRRASGEQQVPLPRRHSLVEEPAEG